MDLECGHKYLKAGVLKCVVVIFFGQYIDSSVQVFYLKKDLYANFSAKTSLEKDVFRWDDPLKRNAAAIWQISEKNVA